MKVVSSLNCAKQRMFCKNLTKSEQIFVKFINFLTVKILCYTSSLMAKGVTHHLITGNRLDSFARSSLWEGGLDYLHGTGHGVGSFLNVHEGNISPTPKLH